MIIQSSLPNKGLAHIIKEYYYIQINSENGSKEIPIIDDCHYDFVFFKEKQATFFFNNPAKKIEFNEQIFTIHNLKPPYKIGFQGSLTFFTIKLQPWVNSHFFSWIREKGVIGIKDLASNPIDLYNQVFETDLSDNSFKMADEFMLNNIFDLSASMELTKSICEYIHELKGKISVKELSEHFNLSRQYLNRLFKMEVMYSIKNYITMVRILDLVKYKSKHPEISLTQVCYDYGYFDQAHFITDFKKVCGVKPSHFFNNLPEFLLRH